MSMINKHSIKMRADARMGMSWLKCTWVVGGSSQWVKRHQADGPRREIGARGLTGETRAEWGV